MCNGNPPSEKSCTQAHKILFSIPSYLKLYCSSRLPVTAGNNTSVLPALRTWKMRWKAALANLAFPFLFYKSARVDLQLYMILITHSLLIYFWVWMCLLCSRMPILFSVQQFLMSSDTGFVYPEERQKCQLQEQTGRAMLNQGEISSSFIHVNE